MFGKVFEPLVKVTKVVDNLKKISDAFEMCEGQEVYVGIPDGSAKMDRKSGTITNAQLAFIHEHGARTPKWAMLNAYRERFQNQLLASHFRAQGQSARAKKYSVKWSQKAQTKADAVNALDAYLFAKGSPWWNIPPRPFLEPALDAHKAEIALFQKSIITAALEGKIEEAKRQTALLGLFCQAKVKGWFTDARNGWQPNHPMIIAIKGSDKPLIDTGALRNSITYVVRQEGQQNNA